MMNSTECLPKLFPIIGTSTYVYDITNGVDEGCWAETSTDPKGNTTIKTYDRTGRLWKVTADNRTITYSYYDNGSRREVIYPDNSKETYAYYNNNLLQELKNIKPDGTVFEEYSYTYDAANNMTSKAETVNGVSKGTTSYTYDILNRLKTVTEPNDRVTVYTFDASGNRQTETITFEGNTTLNTYTYNDQNRLMGITTKVNNVIVEVSEYTYDANGNQLTITKTPYTNGVVGDAEVIAVNEYDKLNQLTKTITGDIVVENSYNGEGLRVEKTVDGNTTRYLYEHDKVVLEVDGDTDQQMARNIYGINLLIREVGTESYYYMYNGHADVTALINTETGTVDATYYYDAFGNIIESTGDVNNNITYAGYQYDEETGLYYLNARMYDPKIARFLQEDTYRGDPNDPLSLNLYVYCLQNPLVYWDPTGHYAVNGSDAYIRMYDKEAYIQIGELDKKIQEYDNRMKKAMNQYEGQYYRSLKDDVEREQNEIRYEFEKRYSQYKKIRKEGLNNSPPTELTYTPPSLSEIAKKTGYYQTEYNGCNIHIYITDPSKEHVTISLGKKEDYVEDFLEMGFGGESLRVNGALFNFGGTNVKESLGCFTVDGKIYKSKLEDYEKNYEGCYYPSFVYYGDGKSSIMKFEKVSDFEREAEKSNWIISGAQGIVVDGKIISKADKRYWHTTHTGVIDQAGMWSSKRARTFMGIRNDGSFVFIVTEEEPGLTTIEGGPLMYDLGCVNAMSFDGGGSSKMYLNSIGGYVCGGNSGRKIGSVFHVVSGKEK